MIAHLFLSALLAATPANGPVKHVTDVKADADDELTQKFADALRKAMPHARHMRLETGDDQSDLYLTVLFKLDPEDKRFTYSVDLMKDNQPLPPNRLASLTGTCRKTDLDGCARDVVEKADKKTGD
jgi:hypothetical protein